MKSIKFIDLFCGIGGIRLGIEKAGFECVFSCDINAECRKTYFNNFNEMPQDDIKKISESDIPDFDILCAGFPCQPFSISGKQKGFDDDRGTLFFEICRFIKAKQPQVVLLENVKHLVHHDKGRTLSIMLEKLSVLGYNVEWKLLNALDFGVPQNRERIVIIASKSHRFDFNRIKIAERKTLIDFLDSKGEFEFLTECEYTLIENPKIQKQSGLCFAGYRNKTIRKAGVRPGTEHLSRVHKQPNRIYSVMGTHPTLPSQESSGRFWILTTDNRVRKLTIDECYRIMGFPENFIRVATLSEQYKQIGNSVCVPMITAVAEAIETQFFSKDIKVVYRRDAFRTVATNL
ncbi:MAG: DNA (cytosine-5-)-methyltransferase [Oscillospiraceae bacterium]|nr:DNA (cytosine-5-)-methyltransferase [Oscillospiraceae bacterium]